MDDMPVASVAPWTIDAVPTETRNKVTAAAQQEGLTLGQWLERRVDEWLADGGPVTVSQGQPRSETRVTCAPNGAAATPELREVYAVLKPRRPRRF